MLKVWILSNHIESLTKWKKELDSHFSFIWLPESEAHAADLWWIDTQDEDWEKSLSKQLTQPKPLWLLVHEQEENKLKKTTLLLEQGQVDDVIIFPIRVSEIFSKIKIFNERKLWREIKELNKNFSQLIGSLKEDLQLAERLQKAHLPKRFNDLRGLKVNSRYFAGGRPGGDFFDIAEGRGKASPILIILTDASSYGLSSAVIASLMRVGSQFGGLLPPSEVIESLQTELQASLGHQHELSIFWGVLERETLEFQFVNLGSIQAFLRKSEDQTKSNPWTLLPQTGQALRGGRSLKIKHEKIFLHPGERLFLASDGVRECLDLETLLTAQAGAEPNQLLNEIAFEVKKKFPPQETFPPQDITAICLDIDTKALRVLKNN